MLENIFHVKNTTFFTITKKYDIALAKFFNMYAKMIFAEKLFIDFFSLFVIGMD